MRREGVDSRRPVRWTDDTLKAAETDSSVREFMDAAERRDIEGMRLAMANGDFSTPKNGAVFWTGREEGNFERAVKSAVENGGRTIEMTPMGRAMDEAALYSNESGISRRDADELWNTASTMFAEGASGVATVYESQSRDSFEGPSSPVSPARSDGTLRTFYARELPILERRFREGFITNLISDAPTRRPRKHRG